MLYSRTRKLLQLLLEAKDYSQHDRTPVLGLGQSVLMDFERIRQSCAHPINDPWRSSDVEATIDTISSSLWCSMELVSEALDLETLW